MKKIQFGKVMAIAALLALGAGQASAQGFLKKLKKATETVTETVSPATDENAAEADTTAVKIKWDVLPEYKAQLVYEVSAEGDTLKNDDGTAKFYVILVDQFGQRRTPETVKAQQKKIKEAITAILVKVGGGALIGGLANGGKGALVGAGAGALASIDDIKQAKKWKKVLNQQEKLLDAYNKNFTDEGLPKNADVDPSTIEDLSLNKSEATTASTEAIKEQATAAQNYDVVGDEAFDF